ncbi:MAG TPA: hypothetical protein VND21_05345 [Planctomycetota bacterium]|nr:hypothetical protein [Planctomycetota bacterium]
MQGLPPAPEATTLRRAAAVLPLAFAVLAGTAFGADAPREGDVAPRAGDGAPRAGDAPPRAGDPAPSPPPALRTLTDTEAEPLVAGLKKAVRARKAEDALPALEAIAGVTHKDFDPLLSKCLIHPHATIAEKTAALFGDRPGPKTTGTIWRAWIHPVNDKRWAVKSAMLASLGRLGATLDAKQYDEVEKIWKMAPNVPAMNAVTAYFTAVRTDKRPCKLLGMWLDEPRAGSVNDASNPPAGYWEARWKLWQATKGGAIAALKAITGQTFDSSAQAKAWFDANPKFGVKW